MIDLSKLDDYAASDLIERSRSIAVEFALIQDELEARKGQLNAADLKDLYEILKKLELI